MGRDFAGARACGLPAFFMNNEQPGRDSREGTFVKNAIDFNTTATPERRRADCRFYVGMTCAMVVVVIAGFGPGLVNTGRRLGPVSPMVILHGLVFTAWLVLFAVQSALIKTRKTGLHRRLGSVGALLAVLMVVSGYSTAISMVRRGYDLSGDLNAAADPMIQLVFMLGDLLAFGLLVGLGVVFRRRADVHKRLMFLATVGGLMSAPLAHVIGHMPALRDKPAIILLPLGVFWASHAVYDRLSFGRIHPVSLWGAVAVFVWSNVRAAIIGPSAAWHQFGAWLAGL